MNADLRGWVTKRTEGPGPRRGGQGLQNETRFATPDRLGKLLFRKNLGGFAPGRLDSADLESAPRLQNELSGGCGHDFFLREHGLAQGLEFQEHVEVDLEVLRQLLFVGGDVRQELRVVAESERLDHGGVDFGMRRFHVACELLGMAESEDVFFDGLDAIDSPGILRESLGELDFDHPVRFEGRDEFRDEFAVSVGVGFDHEDGLTRDRVTAAPEHRFPGVQRDRFGTPVEYVHRFSPWVELGRSCPYLVRPGVRGGAMRVAGP